MRIFSLVSGLITRVAGQRLCSLRLRKVSGIKVTPFIHA